MDFSLENFEFIHRNVVIKTIVKKSPAADAAPPFAFLPLEQHFKG